MAAQETDSQKPKHTVIRDGACFRIDELVLAPGKSSPESVSVCPDDKSKFSGIGVIEKVITPGSEPVFRADGFRIRVPSGAKVSFHGNIKTLADLAPDTWVHFAGKLDSAGILVVSQADFLSARLSLPPIYAQAAPNDHDKSPLVSSKHKRQTFIVNENGAQGVLQGKFTLDESSHGWHVRSQDEAIQERVQRIGARVVPEYQKQLPPDDPSKISFRFFVIDDKWLHSYVPNSILGVILVPKVAVDRLASDDQLAALLADAVAYHLQLQRTIVLSTKLVGSGAEVASWIAVLTMESAAGSLAVGLVAKNIVDHEQQLRLEEERGRITLGLLADAGYDPWQSPDAWRLLGLNKLPRDITRVQYPHVAKYQLKMLVLQYPMGPELAKDAPSLSDQAGQP